MTISKYNHFILKDGKYLLYNALSNALIEITQDLYNILKGEEYIELIMDQDKEIYSQLLSAKVIVEDDVVELLKLKRYINERRYDTSYASFTILPTLDCNFSCPYCFENKKAVYMSDSVIEKVSLFIRSIIDGKKGFNITWFGGEPLLASKQIRKLHEKINAKNESIYSSIITNGYLLNKNNIQLLKDIGVSEIQITLDGEEATHNSRKVLSHNNGANVYKKTIENIVMACEANFANINIRVNIDKNNQLEFTPLKEHILSLIPDKNRLRIAPAFIQVTPNNPCENGCLSVLSNNEMVNYVEELFHTSGYLHSIVYPSNMLYECPVRNWNSWVIGPDAELYKCWEVVGDKQYEVGHINDDGTLTISNEKVLYQYLEDADPFVDKTCSDCSLYPACGGGCVHRRIQYQSGIIKDQPCTLIKNNLEKFLSLFYEYSEEK